MQKKWRDWLEIIYCRGTLGHSKHPKHPQLMEIFGKMPAFLSANKALTFFASFTCIPIITLTADCAVRIPHCITVFAKPNCIHWRVVDICGIQSKEIMTRKLVSERTLFLVEKSVTWVSDAAWEPKLWIAAAGVRKQPIFSNCNNCKKHRQLRRFAVAI